MFARRYFDAPFFAPRYFPPIGAGAPPDPVGVNPGDQVFLTCAIRTRAIVPNAIRTHVDITEER